MYRIALAAPVVTLFQPKSVSSAFKGNTRKKAVIAAGKIPPGFGGHDLGRGR
jgi:hypothetical protein